MRELVFHGGGRLLAAGLATTAALALSGCGGGGSNGAGGGIGDQVDDLRDALLDLDPATAVPGSGTATYDGLAGIYFTSPEGPEAAVGQLEMIATFGANTLGGSISNVQIDDGPSLGGSLTVGGTIAGVNVNATANGTLTGSNVGDITAALTMDGTFRGDGATPEGVYGNIVSGTLTAVGYPPDTLLVTGGEFGGTLRSP